MATLPYKIANYPISRLAEQLIDQSRMTKRTIAFLCDAVAVVISVGVTWYVRTDRLPPLASPFITAITLALACTLPTFICLGIYRPMFRYVGNTEISAVTRAIFISSFPFFVVITLCGLDGIPRVLGFFSPAMLLLLVLASRSGANLVLRTPRNHTRKQTPKIRALIYGAGAAGVELLAGLRHNPQFEIVGFLDDDRRLIGRSILGIGVFASAELADLKEDRHVASVLLAMPSVGRQERTRIISSIREQGLSVQTMPTLFDLAHGRVAVTDLHEVDVIDLLGREPVEPSLALLRGTVEHRVILVTGAGGSIGSELCRQLIRGDPRMIILVDHSEFALYSMVEELKHIAPSSLHVHPILGSVTNYRQMEDIFDRYAPDTVYHAAAYKHVPLVESNVCEAIFNNVFGTLVMAQLAQRQSIGNFTLVSTDKAVRPTSVMGATKRLAEIVVQAMSALGGQTLFSIVRFGNVLGSSGSVIPLFRRQILAGGPVTVTHPDITRYFMTISEASQLVLQAASMAEGGDVFLLDMGDPMKIVDLARAMIELSGLQVKDSNNCDGDVEIAFTGLRPGEKLYEELLIDAEAQATAHSRIFRATEHYIPWSELGEELNCLREEVSRRDMASALLRLARLVPGFRRQQAVAISAVTAAPTAGLMDKGGYNPRSVAS